MENQKIMDENPKGRWRLKKPKAGELYNVLKDYSEYSSLPGVNFINIKCANFSYEHWFWQLFSSYMNVAETTFVRKICSFNVDEIDTN